MRHAANSAGGAADARVATARNARKSPFTVDLIEFVRPDPSWPYPYTIEQAFSRRCWRSSRRRREATTRPRCAGTASGPRA